MEPIPKRIPYMEYEASGTLRFGMNRWITWGTAWPLAQLRASPKEIFLHMRGSWEPDRVLPRESVAKILPLRGFWGWGGIRFEHDAPRCPRYVEFRPWSCNREGLLRELRAMGYSVE